MSGPPNWDDVPPPDESSYGGALAGGSGRGGRRNSPPPMTQEQLKDASRDFYEWLETLATLDQLRMLLPDHVDPKVFIATAKTAVLIKPKLLRETLRQSLLIAIMKAAAMGLLPDGKQGALVERYDTDANGYLVAFQPMVWGIAKLGRETGAIKTIRAVLVFRGETFRILAGEEDRIEHEVDPDIVEEAYGALNGGKDTHGNPLAKATDFLARVRAAYCFLTAPDGTVTRRWMTHQRIVSLFESTKAAKGPWNGRFIDEMIIKGIILFTSKWINLDQTTAEAKRFQAALMTDMEVDFNRQGQVAAPIADEPRYQVALPAPEGKLGSLEDAIMNGITEKATRGREIAPVDPEPGSSPPGSTVPGATGGGDRDGLPPPGPQTAVGASVRTQQAAAVGDTAVQSGDDAANSAPDAPSFIVSVETALAIDGGAGHRWLKRLEQALQTCPSLDDLAAILALPSVKTNRKDAPIKQRARIDELIRAAGGRLTAIVGEEAPMEETVDA